MQTVASLVKPVLLRRVVLGLLAVAIAVGIEWARPTSAVRVDEALRDVFARLYASTEDENRITVVDINEASLDELGPWPWPRERIADLVETLFSTYHAKVVGLDIVFPESAPGNGDRRLASLATHAPLTLAQIFDYTERRSAILQGSLVGGQPAQNRPQGVARMTAFGYIANHEGLAGSIQVFQAQC